MQGLSCAKLDPQHVRKAAAQLAVAASLDPRGLVDYGAFACVVFEGMSPPAHAPGARRRRSGSGSGMGAGGSAGGSSVSRGSSPKAVSPGCGLIRSRSGESETSRPMGGSDSCSIQ